MRNAKSKDNMNPKVHPWRKCPLGQHWRKGHPMRTRSGNVVQRRGGCVQNRSGKDQIYTDEMELISQSEFDQLSGLPAGKRLGFSQGSKFDREIRGWCKYWNDVLGAQDPIDPDLVKALIATESGFRASVKIKDGRGQGHATGLMQITDATRLILSDEDGELKDHLVNVNESELKNPTFNIAAGIRWLFHKKSLASKRLGHEASWQETIMVYKGYKRLDHPQKLKFIQILQELKK
jgi:hypothetical protein